MIGSHPALAIGSRTRAIGSWTDLTTSGSLFDHINNKINNACLVAGRTGRTGWGAEAEGGGEGGGGEEEEDEEGGVRLVITGAGRR